MWGTSKQTYLISNEDMIIAITYSQTILHAYYD